MTEQNTKTDSDKSEALALRLMRVLEATPGMSQRELAERSGISLGSVHYCLKALMAKGLVKMQNFARSGNKLGYVYVITPSGLIEKAALTRRFLQRKQQEYEALQAEIKALRNELERYAQSDLNKYQDSGA